MAPGTEFARDFCALIGPLQFGVVLVLNLLIYKQIIVHRCLKYRSILILFGI